MLDSLAHGVPLVAVPITYEQPAIARRVQWAGCGRSVALSGIDSRSLRRVLVEVLENDNYRAASLQMREEIVTAGGVSRATSTIENAAK